MLGKLLVELLRLWGELSLTPSVPLVLLHERVNLTHESVGEVTEGQARFVIVLGVSHVAVLELLELRQPLIE